MHAYLRSHFGEGSIFLDEASIPSGVDFRLYIDEQLSSCDALLAVIGENWERACGAKGDRRLDDPDDWVRVGIESALARNIPVIPLLVDRAVLPEASDLPDKLKELVNRKAARVSGGSDFINDANQLIHRLDHLITDRVASISLGPTDVARILSGQIEAEDYLPTPDEVKRFVSDEEARVGIQMLPKARQDLVSELTLQTHHAGQEVLVRYTPSGVIVLAAGANVDRVWEHLTSEQKALVSFAYPSTMI